MPKQKRTKKGGRKSTGNLDAFDQTAIIARNAFRGVQYLRSVLNPELKYKDVSGTSVPGTAPLFATLTAINNGTAYNEREGISIRGHEIEVCVSCVLDIANGVTIDVCRLLLVVDLQCLGAVPTPTDILQTAGDVTSLRNGTLLHRFVLLKDDLFTVSSATSSVVVKRYTLIWPGHVMYKGTSAAIGDAANGQIFLYFQGKENTHPTSFPYWARFRFYDN